MVTPTPKFKTREFKDALSALKEIFDAHSLGVILIDVLERQPAEQIYARMGRQSGGARLASLKKTDLVGQITAGFFAVEDVAFQVMKELDRACQKERHIVASIPEDQAPERIGSYRAIAFKRERAKFVWALSRDDRAVVRGLANRVIKEFFAEAADFETTRAVLEGREEPSVLKDLELAKRLQEQAERLAEAVEKVSDLESKVVNFEEERARLLAAMGAKERYARQEAETREERERELSSLKKMLEEVEADQRVAEQARQSEIEARAMAEDLQQKVRRLSKLAGVSQSLQERQAELEQAKKRIEDAARQAERQAAAFAEEREALVRERDKLRAELEDTREELKSARKQIAVLERRAPAPDELEPRAAGRERIVVLLDQANLAATAHAAYGRKVNFTALLDRLRAGRDVARAIAFVVDNGGTFFDAFCDTLKKSGWELRIKRPKSFADGSTKADWDMGIAMEAITLHREAETCVLVSGDGDFAPLLKQLRRFGQRVEIASFPEGLALELANAADATTRLDGSILE
ncbi:NYN domain-containing protein [Myxococcota bacterium]|nr:NYN domain-containing protein [Myxococcota bacterium]